MIVPDNCFQISVGSIIKNPEMLRFISDYLKTKNTCKDAVKKLPFIIKFIPDQCETQEMSGKAILINGRMLRLFLIPTVI